MPARFSKYINVIHWLGDLLIINIAFLLSYFLQFHTIAGIFHAPYLSLFLYYNAAWVALVLILKPYKFSRISRVAAILRGHFTLVTLHLLLITAFFVIGNAYFFSRSQILTTYAILSFLLFGWKVCFVYLLRIYRKKGFNFRNVIIVGYGELSEDLRKFFLLHPEYGYRLLGFFDNRHQSDRILGTFSDIETYAKENDVSEIYCCLPYIRYTQVKSLIDFGEENLIKVKLIADFRGFSMKGLELERYDLIPVINVNPIPLDDYKNRLVKRTFDLVFSSLVIIFLLSWLMPLLAIIIKLDSKGPVFFKQKRTGKDKKAFWCYKFRSMRVNSEADSAQATKHDNRVTRIGAFLRRTSLDELPQFFNVFLGNMSVVGPRPHMLKHTEEYSKVVEKFMSRHFVKPGITGLAQAKGFRGETKNELLMQNRVRLDRFYVGNWSLIFDIKIILLTISSLIKGSDNAY